MRKQYIVLPQAEIIMHLYCWCKCKGYTVYVYLYYVKVDLQHVHCTNHKHVCIDVVNESINYTSKNVIILTISVFIAYNLFH